MKEICDDIWNLWEKGYWIVIPTNGFVKKDGTCVMGRGLAFQAKQRFPELPKKLGTGIKAKGNIVFIIPEYHIITFPVKKVWWEKADLKLIEKSMETIAKYVESAKLLTWKIFPIYLPRVGCGNGGLEWNLVKPILEKYWDDKKLIICDNGER